MELKASVVAAEAIGTLLETEPNMTLKDLAADLFISTAQASHLNTGRRKMDQETAKRALEVYDHYGFTMQLLHPFSDGSTSPVFDGPEWEVHRNTAKLNTLKEMMDVIKNYEPSCLRTIPHRMTEEQAENVRQMFREYIEARTFIDNFLIVLEQEYNLSVKQETDLLTRKWIKRGWLSYEN